jgi:hypothetical protein
MKHTGVDSVKIIQIRSETEAFNRAFNVLLDMRGGVGDCSFTTKGVDTTFRGNCCKILASRLYLLMDYRGLTENLIANVVLPDKVTKELLIHTSLIDNL